MPPVQRQQRYTKARRCPICGGAEQDPRAKGKRCIGYLSTDGEWARCSRDEHAGSLSLEAKSETYVHAMRGMCNCGTQHGPDRERKASDPEATYDYCDEAGKLLFQVVRFPDKQFRQRIPASNGHGPWEWKLGDTRRVLYRLPELLAADESVTVYIVEGEKDVETMRRSGYLATCNPHGAGKWGVVAELAAKVLKGCDIVVIADNDEKGRTHARGVAKHLHGVASSVTVLRCPVAKDVTDHFAAGGKLAELVPLEGDATAAPATNGAAHHGPPSDPPDDATAEREAIEAEGGTRVTEDWPEPYALDAHGELPAFPVEALSPWMRDWVAAESVSTQTPVDLSACLALASASLAIARVAHVTVRSGWVEPCNLWLVVALPPGERKSAVYADATRPIYAYMRLRAQQLAPQIAAAAFDRKVLEGRLKKAEQAGVDGKRLNGIDAADEAREIRSKLDDLPNLRAPELLTDDCTSEKLAVLLEENSERMGLFSSEGGPIELMGGRYTEKGSNFEIYLKAHPGDPHIVHRISREAISLAHPLLTMALTVQPSVIAGLAARDGFRGRGLLARFFYSTPESAIGHRDSSPPAVPDHISLAYHTAVGSLLLLPAAQRVLVLDAEASELRASFQREIEPRLGIDGDLRLIGDWANKFVGGVCRLAAVLHVSDYATAYDSMPDAVPAATLVRAITLGRYFLTHAEAAFAAMGADVPTDFAKRILAWCRRKQARTWSARELQRAMSAPADAVALAIAVLLERGLARERSQHRAPATPGRPCQEYEVHPSVVPGAGFVSSVRTIAVPRPPDAQP